MFNLKIKNIFLNALVIIVSVLVIIAIYSNINKFTRPSIERYTQINIRSKSDINEVMEKYSNPGNKEMFLAEIKKVNNIKSLEHIGKKTIIIPIIKSK